MAFISSILPTNLKHSTSSTSFITPLSQTISSVKHSKRSFSHHIINMAGGPQRSTVVDTPRKEFLDRLKPLGKVRLIARNESAIMEAIATFDGLFFATVGSGEYANIVDMSINLDMHLLLSKVSGARFEIGISRSASKDPTYIIRILGSDKKNTVLSAFLHWDKEPSDIEPHRIEAWKQLKQDYTNGDEDSFFFEQ